MVKSEVTESTIQRDMERIADTQIRMGQAGHRHGQTVIPEPGFSMHRTGIIVPAGDRVDSLNSYYSGLGDIYTGIIDELNKAVKKGTITTQQQYINVIAKVGLYFSKCAQKNDWERPKVDVAKDMQQLIVQNIQPTQQTLVAGRK